MTGDLFVAGITLGEDGNLIIDRVKKEDEGLYECVARNVEGFANTSASITVHGETNITLEHLERSTHALFIKPVLTVKPVS